MLALPVTVAPAFERQHVKVSAHEAARHLDLADVRIDDEGVWLDAKLVLPRAEIASVSLTLDERATVHLEGRRRAPGIGRGLSFTFTDRADVDGMLSALGRTVESTRTDVDLEPSLVTFGFRELPLWKAGIAISVALVLLVLSFMLLARPTAARGLNLARLLARKLEIGADGLHVRMAFTKEFLPYRDIAAIAERNDAIVVTLRNGHELTLKPSVGGRIGEVVARIRRALEGASPPGPPEIARRLEVAGTNTERVAALRELGKGTSYRDGELPRDALWDTVEDARLDGGLRTRAAIALSSDLTTEERARLRVAMDATVHPKVRVALDAALDGDDDRIAAVLDDMHLPGAE